MSRPPGAPVDLRALPFFARLPDGAIRTLESGLHVERYRRGEVLSSPDRPAAALTVVRSGRLELSGSGTSRVGKCEELGPGGWFGAGSVLLGSPEARTVVAAEDAEVAKLPSACIDVLLRSALREALGPEVQDAACGPGAGLAPPPGPQRTRSARPRVGLALSGGGAKAFAHLGVLKVLCGAGIPLDVLAGTSAGAIAAAMFCAGRSVPEMFAFADRLRQQVLRRDGMWDFLEAPTVGLIRGERTRALYDGILEGKRFADLLKPLWVPAADLVTGEAVVLRAGAVSDAVRASAGIPGLYAPWPHGGRYLVEGGLVNPLPVDLVREQGADLVIASQVIRSAAEIRVEPLEAPSPNLLGLIAARANAILEHHVRDPLPEADVLIRPEVDDYDVLDYPMAEELIALGEAAAEARLPEICRLLAAGSKPRWHGTGVSGPARAPGMRLPDA